MTNYGHSCLHKSLSVIRLELSVLAILSPSLTHKIHSVQQQTTLKKNLAHSCYGITVCLSEDRTAGIDHGSF